MALGPLPPPSNLKITVDGGAPPPPVVKAAPPPPAPPTDLEKAIDNLKQIVMNTGHKSAPYILYQLLQNVILLMQTVQQTGIIQSNQLSLLTQAASICTDLMNSQKVYSPSDFAVTSDAHWTPYKDATAAQTALNTFNQNSSTWTQRFQALRDQATNAAKTVQSGSTSTDQSQQALSDFLQTFLQTIQSATQQLFSR